MCNTGCLHVFVDHHMTCIIFCSSFIQPSSEHSPLPLPFPLSTCWTKFSSMYLTLESTLKVKFSPGTIYSSTFRLLFTVFDRDMHSTYQLEIAQSWFSSVVPEQRQVCISIAHPKSTYCTYIKFKMQISYKRTQCQMNYQMNIKFLAYALFNTFITVTHFTCFYQYFF